MGFRINKTDFNRNVLLPTITTSDKVKSPAQSVKADGITSKINNHVKDDVSSSNRTLKARLLNAISPKKEDINADELFQARVNTKKVDLSSTPSSPVYYKQSKIRG